MIALPGTMPHPNRRARRQTITRALVAVLTLAAMLSLTLVPALS